MKIETLQVSSREVSHLPSPIDEGETNETVRRGFKSLCVSTDQGSRLDAMSGTTRRKETGSGDVEDALGGLTLDPKA